MNFTDRTMLGTMLASKLQQFRGKDAIILCLQESSLLTCLTMASELRAWVYPLIYVPVYTPDHSHRLLGAFDPDGEFCPLRTDPASALEVSPKNTDVLKDTLKGVLKSKRKGAMKSIDTMTASYGMKLDKHHLDGRDVILAADVIISPLPLLVAQQFLKSVAPKSLTAVAGNATPETAQLLRISASKTEILDILSGIVSDENHYFNHISTHTSEQRHELTQRIAAYWQ